MNSIAGRNLEARRGPAPALFGSAAMRSARERDQLAAAGDWRTKLNAFADSTDSNLQSIKQASTPVRPYARAPSTDLLGAQPRVRERPFDGGEHAFEHVWVRVALHGRGFRHWQ